LLRLPGVGPVFAAILRAEIGEITRSLRHDSSTPGPGSPHATASQTPPSTGGGITKQGSRLVRWAMVEAVQRARLGTPMRNCYEQIVARRGGTAKHLAKVAAARELCECVFYALRDGHVRRLRQSRTA
jgi:transposase